MKYRKNFRKKKKYPKEELQGLQVKVFNNNVDGALRILKKKVKESNLFLYIYHPIFQIVELIFYQRFSLLCEFSLYGHV